MAKRRYHVEFTPAAARQQRKLPVDVQRRVVRALEELESDPRPHGARKLAGEDNLWRLRVGDFRVIYSIEDNRLLLLVLVLVVRVANRRDVYDR